MNDPAPARATGDPGSGADGSPSNRQRLLAMVSLVASALLVVWVLGLLIRTPALIVGGILGLTLLGAGGWWAVTEQHTRRLVGIAAALVGAGVILASLWAAASDPAADWERLALAVLLAVVAVASARAAMVRDLHLMDRLAQGRVRPDHPVLICNPKSGGGKVGQFGLVELAQQMGVEVVMLEPGTDLEQLARDAVARGADCLGMAGGDGSQALVASVAIEHDLPFVPISAGTRNHFALDLGLDRDDPRKGMVAFTDGVPRRVDYATVGDRLFVNNVSLGVYATVVQGEGYRDAKRETFMEDLPKMLGNRGEPFDLQFTTPDGQEVDDSFLIMVSNNPYVMAPALDFSQRRSMDGGILGVVAVSSKTGAEAGALVARAALGTANRDPNYHQFETTQFEVRSRGGTAAAGIDGEALHLDTPLRFTIHPRGLGLLVPAGAVVEAEIRRARQVSVADLLAVARGRTPKRLRETPGRAVDA
jgi:diacylglycerol kinase family enzyme